MKTYLYNLATDKIDGFIARIIKFLLLILSFIYARVIRLIIFCYAKNIFKKYKADCPVISVGNITLGGTGKTPNVEMLAKHLKNSGHKVAILSRGYKRIVTSYQLPVTSYKTIGDEPYMLSQNLPDVLVLVGKDRINNVKKAINEFGVDTIILDDGFQYCRLFRDLDIVLLDAANPFGNGRVLPRGILREPLSSLRRADIFVLTKDTEGDLSNLSAELKVINPNALIVEATRKPVGFFTLDNKEISSSEINQKEACILCSIGNPKSFYNTVVNLGLKPVLKFFFLDHHNYSKKDMQRIMESCHKNNIQTVITTEKDMVRLKEHWSLVAGHCLPARLAAKPRAGKAGSLLYLRIELIITKNQDEFYKRISNLYNR